MSDDFYPFVDSGDPAPDNAHITGGGADELRAQAVDMNAAEQVSYATRIAIYDDMLSTPRVIVIAPRDVRTYLEEITNTVYRCMKEQGGGISLMVIREIVENFIHANFVEPIISILDDGNTIRFSDQGPGIKEKSLALEYGTSSATEEMKHYIRGVGSGLPYVQQYMADKGGSLEVEDNISGGTVVTISTHPKQQARAISGADQRDAERNLAPQAVQSAAPGAASAWFSQPQTPMTPQLTLDERGEQVLTYLSEHESCGPTDLVRTFGASGATWSRTLAALAAQGIVMKDGQKYRLTGIGRTFV